MKLGIAEILGMVAAAPKKEEKIRLLRQHENIGIRTILKMFFDKRIKWLLPEGDAPFKPCPYPDQEGMLYNEIRRLYLFMEGGNSNLTSLKRQQLFIGLLESLMPEDAKLLIGLVNKKMPYKGITEKLIDEAYPGLLDYTK